MGRLDGKVALITGAASGIGRAIARRFAAEGAAIVIADLSESVREGGEPTRALIEAGGHPVRFVATDVSDESQAQAAVDTAVAAFGKLDILVNNAAIGTDTPLTDTPLGDWNRVMAVNLTGPFLMARAAVRQMLTQEIVQGVRGRIVNITSQHGMVAAPNDIAYGVSKSGLVYMTRQIAVDYAKHHILCNAVAPGKILTGKTGRAVAPEILAYSESRTPMPRLGTPDDVASAALFLASDDASYVTGENLMVDGGWMAY
ncbi:SDR family NAD(P)-dependent oxidoreductase [Oceanibaculum nanhaiense]|jgi:NAD(P)-dependent dehydrogenase (short-subunit alcohol dehydrogenase family)|uniref:SDR family NAD(P)-dependent oxidoreductase n=1 Tax=Oceanibaculum nanhaiense TaxID=1909734 RepID=UPI000A3AA1BA|nr:SDR family oxidoreductase [Oceanibaculum nanhaiense]MBC7135658.1 SDR family oxidoreductase [Oceanibaculum nanhaiense]